jgi:hypothetical protein
MARQDLFWKHGQVFSKQGHVDVHISVESRCGAVSLRRTYLFLPLFSGGALVVRPWLRFHIPLIEPDVQISRIRLSDKPSRLCFGMRRLLQFLDLSWSL